MMSLMLARISLGAAAEASRCSELELGDGCHEILPGDGQVAARWRT
jgi:hypothetical protein